MIDRPDARTLLRRAFLIVAAVTLAVALADVSSTQAQDETPAHNRLMQVDAADIRDVMEDADTVADASASVPSGIDLLTLITRGGAFMIPIALMSFMVVALAVERLLTLRGRKIIPPMLVQDLREIAQPIDRFSPASALESCRDQPSPAARVVRAMLMRTGQPLADVERAASEAVEREADRYAAPIRWLTLAAAATPLMGLLGTVWGMIVAFHESTTLTPDRSRSEQLSEGIYTALVTTLAGLVVAIPAAILALYLENRLARLFRRVEELAFEIAPGLARFTGTHRLDSDGSLQPLERMAPPTDAPQPPPAPRTAGKKRGGAKAG